LEVHPKAVKARVFEISFHNAGQGWISARADFMEALAVCWSW
jgi:hypothetical protein